MTYLRMGCIALLTALWLSGCQNMGPVSDLLQQPDKQVASGIKSYEDGDYQTALATLQKAQASGLKNKRDQLLTHKYLAFIHCVGGREKQCREEFRKALELDPAFELKAAEAGHPVWGPIFRGEKIKYEK